MVFILRRHIQTDLSNRLTSLLKSAGIRQSYPNSTRIPNCTPVIGIGAPTLYVILWSEVNGKKGYYKWHLHTSFLSKGGDEKRGV